MNRAGLIKTHQHAPFQKQRILLVKDEKDSKFFLKRLLEIQGFQVISVSNRTAAFGLFNSSFELVLAELSQSNNGGIEFIQAIQRINPGIKCIIMTSHSEDNFPDDIQLLIKPFSNIQLVECIKRTLKLSEIQATEERAQLSFDENTMSNLQVFSYNNEIRGYVK
ncbi:MAG: response regulator [Candidatus Heimdallarchaeaceae archaeon]